MRESGFDCPLCRRPMVLKMIKSVPMFDLDLRPEEWPRRIVDLQTVPGHEIEARRHNDFLERYQRAYVTATTHARSVLNRPPLISYRIETQSALQSLIDLRISFFSRLSLFSVYSDSNQIESRLSSLISSLEERL